MCCVGQMLAQRSISSDQGAEQLLQINKLVGKIQRKVTSQQGAAAEASRWYHKWLKIKGLRH